MQSGQFSLLGAIKEEAVSDAEQRMQCMKLCTVDNADIGFTVRQATLFERLYIG